MLANYICLTQSIQRSISHSFAVLLYLFDPFHPVTLVSSSTHCIKNKLKSMAQPITQWFICVFFMMQTNGNILELRDNLKLIEVECADLSHELHCTHESVNNWCQWNTDLMICQNNYSSIMFISPWDIAAMPKSVISILVLFACMFLYWCSELILNNLKVFKHLGPEKRSKCQIYIFELLGIPIAFSYLLYEGTYDVVFRPDRYTNMGPRDTLHLLRSMCSSTFLIYMYAIEMLTNKLRWSLNLHHASVICTGLWFMVLLDGSADLASIRCILASSLYSFTEYNIFIQLLAYRLYPSRSWRLHAFSAVLYTSTRLFVTITFIICYISWAMTDEIHDQLSGHKARDSVYLSFFFHDTYRNAFINYCSNSNR
eukprot:438855_1